MTTSKGKKLAATGLESSSVRDLVDVLERLETELRELKRGLGAGQSGFGGGFGAKAGRKKLVLVAREKQPGVKDQEALIDLLIATLKLKNDAALARALGIPAGGICRYRSAKLLIGPATIIRMHEASGLSIRELKSYLTPSEKPQGRK